MRGFIFKGERKTMRYTTLGKTRLEVSEVGFGCIPIIRLSTEEAVKVLRRAYENGITLFDTANMYLDSEEKMGLAFAGIRSRLVLATKTLKRDRAGAEAGYRLVESLRLLADGGAESDLDESTQDGGLDSTYWHVGLLWTPDSRTRVEGRYGDRFFAVDGFQQLVVRER